MKEETKNLGYPQQTRFMFYSKSTDSKPGQFQGKRIRPKKL